MEHRAECVCPVCLDNLQFDDVQTFLIVKVGTIPIVGGTVLQCLQETGAPGPRTPGRRATGKVNSGEQFWGLMFWHLWIGRAKNPGPTPLQHVAVEVFNVGGWLTHGDLVLEAGVGFLPVIEHRVIPARTRSVWARLGVCVGLAYLPVRIPPMLVMLVLGLSA